MVVEDINFRLKDGRKAVLRNAREEDIEGMLEHLRVSAAETDFIMRTPAECGRYTYEGEKKFFDDMNASPDNVMLVCLVEGRVAGNCNIIFNSWYKTRHRAGIALALSEEFWGQGIGTKMFEEMIRFARERGCVTQIELDFVEGNVRARALYEKMGFRITGVKPNAIRLQSGKLVNEYMMIKEL